MPRYTDVNCFRVREAISCFDRSKAEFEKDGDFHAACTRLSRRLSVSLGNVGLSADYVNSAYYLSNAGVAAVVLFEEDEPGSFSIIRREGVDGEFVTIDTGNFTDGSIQTALGGLLHGGG